MRSPLNGGAGFMLFMFAELTAHNNTGEVHQSDGFTRNVDGSTFSTMVTAAT